MFAQRIDARKQIHKKKTRLMRGDLSAQKTQKENVERERG
jgi:hypothetical protein